MLWYAHGDRAPSAKATNDLALYELALDMHMSPSEIRKMNIRDRNKLYLVNEARKAGAKQIAISQKIEATYVIEV